MDTNTPAPPPGYGADDVQAAPNSQPSAQSVAAPPPPPGYSADDIVPTTGAGSAPPTDSSLDVDDPNAGILTKGARAVNAVGAGVGKGLLDTLSGAAGLASKVDPSFNSVKDRLDQGRAQLDQDNQNNPTLNSTGYMGETLAEFMLGDSALSSLSFADKLAEVSKVAKVLEKSPRLINALKLGAQAAAVQGAQTAIRTDGSVADRAKAGLVTGAETGVVGSVLGGVGNLLEEGLANASKAAKGVPELSKIAATAKSSPEVLQGLSKNIADSESELHAGYEKGIEDLKGRLSGAEVDPQDNPMQRKAEELLQTPIPSDHPAVAQATVTAGAGMDKSTRDLLETIANGNDPAAEAARDEELAEQAKEAAKAKPSGLLDANGKPVSSPKPLDVEPEPIPARPYNIDDLIKLRQTIRQAANNYEPGDVNARALRSLLWDNTNKTSAVDDTISKLAEQSGDDTAVSDYKALRDNYRQHINDYDDPLIQKIRAGKIDDAASQYVGLNRTGATLPAAGKTQYNTDVLRRVIGESGLRQFGKEVFGTMLSSATEDGKFNPAKFMQLWNRVSDQTKGSSGLFDLNTANRGLNQLVKDAKSAANIQHLSRAGVLTGLGALGAGVGAHFSPVAAILGLTVAEGGGIIAGRQLLDWVATHPNTWKAWQSVGSAAPVVAPVAKVATGVTGQAVNSLNGNTQASQQRIYRDATTGLSQ